MAHRENVAAARLIAGQCVAESTRKKVNLIMNLYLYNHKKLFSFFSMIRYLKNGKRIAAPTV